MAKIAISARINNVLFLANTKNFTVWSARRLFFRWLFVVSVFNNAIAGYMFVLVLNRTAFSNKTFKADS